MERRVELSELEEHLGEYIAGVRDGDRVVICEHGRPLAEIVPAQESAADNAAQIVAVGGPDAETLRRMREEIAQLGPIPTRPGSEYAAMLRRDVPSGPPEPLPLTGKQDPEALREILRKLAEMPPLATDIDIVAILRESRDQR